MPDAARDGLADYRDAVQRAEALDETIERTDALIDEIVYELYGLTNEEMGPWRGRSGLNGGEHPRGPKDRAVHRPERSEGRPFSPTFFEERFSSVASEPDEKMVVGYHSLHATHTSPDSLSQRSSACSPQAAHAAPSGDQA